MEELYKKGEIEQTTFPQDLCISFFILLSEQMLKIMVL